MTGREAFKIWTNIAGNWAAWVRPVPFVSQKKETCVCMTYLCNNAALTVTKFNCIKNIAPDCAVILDFAGTEGVTEAVSLAKQGYRPVPLYNGCNPQKGTMSLVDTLDITQALLKAANDLKSLSYSSDAPPVFLLDSNRTIRHKMNVSTFDNSYDLYPQDMPSSAYLIKQGVKKIILLTQKLNKDINAILYKYRKSGIKIYTTNGYEETKEAVLKRPPKSV